MKIYSPIFFLILFSACSGEESVSDQYAVKLEKELIDANQELEQSLSDIYIHFDIAHAQQQVFNCYKNFDSVNERGIELKIYSHNFRANMDKLISFPINGDRLKEIQTELDNYKASLIDLVDSSHYHAEERVQQINDKLALSDFENLQPLNQHEFRIEKEIVKSKFLQVEFLIASQLLAELWLDGSVFKNE